ncbi:MAG TPA: hypothetical protein VEC57_19725 [Candidatus Limnocylindrales bacterium]|nr:hypothetical protein [Candidatus Limnocylindrales bacterium]
MSASAIAFEMHGVRLRLESELPEFLDYARVALQPYATAVEGAFDISSRLEWVDGVPARSLEAAFPGAGWQHRLDRDLYIDGPRGYWLRIDDFPDLQLAIAEEGGRIQVRGRYHFYLARDARGDKLRRFRYRNALGDLRGRRFSTLLYYLFYHPLLWRLSRLEGWHVLHGGAVATPAGAVVLAGMPGCGKSTLAVAMLADASCRMLSDNLVLHDGLRALACPELLLLDENSRRLAGAGASRLTATGERRVYARDAHRIAQVELEPQPIAAIFHVERGQRSRVQRIDATESAARLRAANLMAKEVRRIAIMNEVLDAVACTRRTDEAGVVLQLAAAVPSYELRVGSLTDLTSFAAEEILGRLDAQGTAA